MQPPAAVRRRILYAAAATLLINGLAFAGRSIPSARKDAPEQKPSAVTAQAPTPATQESQQVANGVQAPAAAKGEASAPAKTEQVARPKITTYTVVEGDTVGAIAEKFNLASSTILWANDLSEDDVLQIGQELKIPSVDGTIHTVEPGDTIWGIASAYDVDITKVAEANPDVDAEALQPGQVLVVPGGQPLRRRLSTMVASRGGQREATASGTFGRWPVSGPITDRLGWRTHPVYGTAHFHDGIDIGVPIGTPVAAVARGRVAFVGYLGGYGLAIKVDHGDGVVTMYAHMSEATVESGQTVDGGEIVGYSGNTGASTGPHLHFSVFVGGSPVDPIGWLP